MNNQYPVSTTEPTKEYNATITTVTPTNTTITTNIPERKAVVWSIILYSILIVVCIVLAIFFGMRLLKANQEIRDENADVYDSVVDTGGVGTGGEFE